MKNQTRVLCSVLALVMTGQVSAATSWTFGPTDPAGVNVSVYSNTGNVGSPAPAAVVDNDANAANNGAIETVQSATKVYYPGGVGITNADSCGAATRPANSYCDLTEGTNPEHAIDNQERYDMVLLTFTAGKVKLTDVKLGWFANDSDISVLAYSGSGDPTANGQLLNKTYDTLRTSAGGGWTVIGNYSNLGTTTRAINADGVFSSYWLIGAFNPLATGLTTATEANGTTVTPDAMLYDYVKLASVTGEVSPTTRSVPEPGSMALFGLALMGLVSLRQRPRA